MITISVYGLADSRSEEFRLKVAKDLAGVFESLPEKAKDVDCKFIPNESPVKTEEKVLIGVRGENIPEGAKEDLASGLKERARRWLTSATRIYVVFL